jgi:hypothetical protein
MNQGGQSSLAEFYDMPSPFGVYARIVAAPSGDSFPHVSQRLRAGLMNAACSSSAGA